MINYFDVFIYSNQPVSCPKCNCRTKIILDLSHTKDETQIHKCIDKNCKFEFVIQTDEDFNDKAIL